MNNPGFYVIDSPFMGFDEGETKKIDNNLKYNLLDYLSKNNKQSQLILLENPKGLPEETFSIQNINIIKFTDINRKGFLDI